MLPAHHIRDHCSLLRLAFAGSVALIALAPNLFGQAASAKFLKILGGKTDETPVPAAAPVMAGTQPNIFYANPGPWGKLKCVQVFIEAPTAMVATFPIPDRKPRWSFSQSQLPELPALFNKAGLHTAFAEALLDSRDQVLEEGMVHLFPALEPLENMTPAMREVIYPALAKHPVNEYHANPVLITSETVDEWYSSSKLRPELVAKIRQMSYHRGNCLVFSDLAALLNHANSESEARLILKSATRTRGLMVKLELPDTETNLEEILNYWSTGLNLRRKDIEPILRSLVETEGIKQVDLIHILPALTRKLLYTYPGIEMSREGMLPDCHWSSLNFFNYTPHEYLRDRRLATSWVLEKCEPVDPRYRFGDILFFLNNTTDDAFHSCVYLADNIVYTKNGRNQFSPWLLMKLEDVAKIYLPDGNGRIQGFRHKGGRGRVVER